MGKEIFVGVAIFLLVGVFLVMTLHTSPTTNAINEDVLSGNDQNSSVSGNVVEMGVIAKQYEFVPGTIEVNEGDTVILNIKSIDVEHSFFLPEFNIDADLMPGETSRVEFVADKKGTYTFSCHVYCGPGHKEMSGTLVVN